MYIGNKKAVAVYLGKKKVTGIYKGFSLVWSGLPKYIYRVGSWLVPYSLGEWTDATEYLYISGHQNGKGSKTVGTLLFTFDVTNAKTISVLFDMSIVGSTNAIPRGELKLYSVTDNTIIVKDSNKGNNRTITLDVSTLKGEQTFRLVHTIGQDYEQSPYNYTADTTVKVYNIDVN